MMLFWLICGVFILIALAFVLPAAMQRNEKSRHAVADELKLANIAVYRDQLAELDADLQNGVVSQEQYAQDREEIKRRLLEDTASPSVKPAVAEDARITVYGLVVALPLGSVLFHFVLQYKLAVLTVMATLLVNPSYYLQTGSWNSITNTPPANTQPAAGVERSQAQIDANIAALAERLKTNPNDAQGWTMLARSYSSMQRFGEATGAYAKATELKPDDADLWADYAFASAMASGQRLDGQPTELINQALKVDPENAKALQLAGSAAFQAKDYAKAIQYWERVLKRVPPDSEVAQAITQRINEAKSLGGNK